MDSISKLFGNEPRIKLIRFFLLNDSKIYSLEELQKKTAISKRNIKIEVERLSKAGFIKLKKNPLRATGGNRSKSKKYKVGFFLKKDFSHIVALKNFFITTAPISQSFILKRIVQTGKVKLVIISGIFMENPDSRLDLLVVGDNLNKRSIDRAVHSFEMALGRELRYAHLETSDFNYRLSIFDRLVRDVLDYPHQKILNKIGL